ncbi:MAG: acetamidase/formamidase family protein [Candidatus Parvarchaeota archaeon]|nr:acetamidase/formamidase family protein [Candidatus Jingweiarchaeum tengchongense]MCW1306051.1 acetamidase/formamidase family protein [Candidatus Jingweiarchaeum tengchongense]
MWKKSKVRSIFSRFHQKIRQLWWLHPEAFWKSRRWIAFQIKFKINLIPYKMLGWSKINPATGPIFIKDLEAGDTLKVEILDISVAKKGIMVAGKNEGVLGHLLEGVRTKVVPENIIWRYSIQNFRFLLTRW